MTTAAKSNHARVHAIFVGLPVAVEAEHTGPDGRTLRTGLYKEPVRGRVYLDLLNLNGDGQADLVHHGGRDKAVCVYPRSHFRYWEQRLGHPLPAGAFGENFLVDGATEEQVHLGDIYAIGEATVQVTQPRSPCYKIARRWHKSLALWFQETGYTGWYLRVLQPGFVESGELLELVERRHDRWTIRRLNEIRYGGRSVAEAGELEALAVCDELTAGWRARVQAMLAGEPVTDDQTRLEGPTTK